MDGCGGLNNFYYFFSLPTFHWYIAHLQLYILSCITLCKIQFLWGLNFGQVGEWVTFFQTDNNFYNFGVKVKVFEMVIVVWVKYLFCFFRKRRRKNYEKNVNVKKREKKQKRKEKQKKEKRKKNGETQEREK